MSDRINGWTTVDKKNVEDAIRRGATRRELLNMLLLGGLATAAGIGLLDSAVSAVAATPKRGGSIKVAAWNSSTAETLDPAKASLPIDHMRCAAVYNRLTFLGEDGETNMELAESIDTEDAKVWTVKLRKGITFHDGKSFTSADVIFSLKRHLDPAVGSVVNTIAKQMTGFKAIDDQTIEITLATPNADLPTILAINQFQIVADGTTDFSKGNGTGPFISKVFEPGVRSVAVRNPNYWKPNLPYLDSFELIAISDDTARVNALLSGDVQLAGRLNPRSLPLLDNQPNVKIVKWLPGNYTDLNSRLDMDPGNKAGFATGIKYLFNRELIQKSVLRGLAEIANDQPIGPTNVHHNKDLKPKPYDPDKAKFHFKEAGVLGKSIPIITSEAAVAAIDFATVLQQAGDEIGMKFDVKRVPSDGYWSNYWLKAPVHFGNLQTRPTPDIIFSLLYASDAPWNESHYHSEKFDKMLLEARGMLDRNKRKEIYGEMQVMISEEAGTAIPVFMSNIDAMSSKLQGLRPNPLGGLMGFAFAEYVWLEG
ncbi:ABC transporter substrate-binding protein [Mesorhizobium sp.]|uniref:ABC transporter substrate-binding protein n=1 Tax=Mesorhizobium sp. TaxID=1871066 RepID=UPI000FE9A205|nr:ABC transporter substrate-binding protein [Mesorhizobium sp.]RWB32193.1 MAG: ABC transporter substrate-binding protein [Mesorhizobium sp.]